MAVRTLREMTVTIPTRIKKRVVFVAILFLAFWPILHHVIVESIKKGPPPAFV